MDLFFKHHPTRVKLDSGATGNLIRASFAQYIGAPIQNSNQTVYQPDGQSSLKVIGETNITLSRDKHYFTLEALVIENIDVDVLAGVPFMTANDIAFSPSRRQILLSDGTILEYCAQPSRGAHVVRRAQACVLRAPPLQPQCGPGISLSSQFPSTNSLRTLPSPLSQEQMSILSNKLIPLILGPLHASYRVSVARFASPT